jgi:hypothetical protein
MRLQKVFVLVLIVAALGTLNAQQDVKLIRYGMFVGSNEGGSGREELRYAAKDARSVAQVMIDIGGLEPENTIILENPSAGEIEFTLESMKNELLKAHPDKQVEFIFYYSGHSDEDGLLLGPMSLSYRSLKDHLDGMPADVNIAILDSCNSGSLIRLKGGVRKSPFLLDESVETKGHFYLTSSSEDEAAQESDQIEGSFFTYYLVTALRGAGDTSGDGKVTVHEAYSWAYDETQTRTSESMAGTQHPSYNMNLSGNGEIIMTDLRQSTAQLSFAQGMSGRVYIADYSGRPVMEFYKYPESELVVALPPGYYNLKLDDGRSLNSTDIELYENRALYISRDDFIRKEREQTTSRGAADDPVNPSEDILSYINFHDDPFMTDLIRRLWSMDFVNNIEPDRGTATGSYFGFTNTNSGNVNGFQMSGFGNLNAGGVEGMQLSGGFNMAGQTVYGSQLAGVFNVAPRGVSGYQGSGVFNFSGSVIDGTQMAGVFNIHSGRVNGAQMAGVFNMSSSDVKFLQTAGVFNITGGVLSGSQVAGVFNITQREMLGIQLSGVFNIGAIGVRGFQGAGVFNIASYLEGIQISSVANISGDVNGIQLGLFNLGNVVKGTQIGLINISRSMEGLPLGLINYSSDGVNGFGAWQDSAGYWNGSFQIGTRNVYTIFYGGAKEANPELSSMGGLGMGTHMEFYPFYIEMDLGSRIYTEGPGTPESRDQIGVSAAARTVIGLTIFSRLHVFAGVSFEAVESTDGVFLRNAVDMSPIYENSDFNIQVYPKYMFGVRF